jgi:hypothetical protein
MPIESPRLDDLTFDRTVEELIRRIPVYAPEWTDHNASDPGISLIHLVAHVAEQVAYRLNRVPEKNHIELLKLLGIRLRPAHAARTRLALLLSNPATLVGDVLNAGARARATKGDPPPTFETSEGLSIVPAQTTLLVATKNPSIDDVLLRADGTRESPATLPDVPNNDTEWLSVVWDGKTPKLKDMPIDPVALVKRPGQPYLWIGVDYNHDLNAGFRAARVSLSIQLDDDEQPDVAARVRCETPAPAGDAPPVVDWLHYFDAVSGTVQRVAGRIDDSTNRVSRSGEIRFTVPLNLGPVAAWTDMRTPPVVTGFEACLEMGNKMRTELGSLNPLLDLTAGKYGTVLDAGIIAAKNKAAASLPQVLHPLDPALRANAKAWFRVTLPAPAASARSPRIRIVSFNTVAAVHATTVLNELMGRADGRPGQQYALSQRNVLPDSLVLEIQEDSVPATPLVRWTEVDSLDGRGPFESVYELDREAGRIAFGDAADPDMRLGRGGRIPPLVPNGGEIVARRYQYGGGKAGEVPAASIKALETAVAGVSEVVNYVAATGGRDGETLEEAKRRARKELSTRSRAVTAGDFEWIARQTPSVRVARAHIVPLRRPLPASASAPVPPSPPRCGPALAAGPLGLAAGIAPGAVTVVVVPDETGPEPLPTRSFLREVCRHLDLHRLVSTEVHVVPPQYCRLCNVLIKVRARPGYSRARLQQLVEQRLTTYLHVLRGGEDGKGFPFGSQVHIADLMAQVFRTEGIERVEDVSAEFTRTRSQASPREGQLVLCPTTPGQADRVALSPEENVSIDVTSISLSTVV